MANGAINFKNNSGNIVSFISGSGSDIIISGGTLNLSNMTGLTLGNLTMEGTVETASFAPSYLLTSSFNTYSGTTNTVIGTLQTSTASLNTRISTIEGVTGSYATTGSNIFKSSQTITGSLFVSENLVIAGSSSIQYISSSIVNIDDNIITVNAMNPSVRFGGLSVIDSGSSPQVSGSMLFDSINNQWIFVHQNQSSVTSSVLLMGPETYDNLGNEAYITANRLVKSTGIEHLSDSNITDTGTKVSINSNTEVTGSLIGTSTAVFGSSVTATSFEVGNGQYFKARRSSSNLLIDLLGIESGTDNTRLLITGDLNIKNGSLSTLLNMTTTGAATFSSSVADYAATITNVQDSSQGLLVRATDNDTTLYLLNLQSSNGSTSQTWVDRFVVTKSGNVGIGLTSPNGQLSIKNQISNGSNPVSSYAATSGVEGQNFFNGYYAENSDGLGPYPRYLDIVSVGSPDGSNGGSNIRFFTNPVSTSSPAVERMRINSSGNVGIGTTSPSAQLNVGHESHGIGISYLGSSSLPAIAGLFTDTSSGQQGYGSLLIKSRSDYAGYSINFYTAASANTPLERMRITSSGITIVGHTAGVGTNFSPPIQVKGGAGIGNGFGIISGNNEMVGGLQLISSSTNSLNITADPDNLRSSSEIGFSVDGTERMRITSDGKVIVRQSNFTYPVSIEAQSGGGQLALTRSGAYTEFYMGGTTGGGTQLYVRSGGSGGVRLDAGSTGWVADSDIRLKDIEKPIENAVESLSTLQTVYYSWKDSENVKQHLGLIAQEVEEVFPEIVSESSITGMKGVNYIELIPVLVKAIQELKAELEIAKAEIQTLKQ